MDRFVVLAAVTVIFMAVIVPAALFWHGRLSPRAHMRRRVEALGALFAERPVIGEGRGEGGGEGDAGVRRRLIQGKLKELERQRSRDRRNTVRHLILQSGLALSLRGFVIGSAVFGLAAGGLLASSGMGKAVCLIGALGAALGPPRLMLKILIKRRQKRFTQHFADALDILVRGTRSGLPVGECLRIVARESPDPVGPEFDFLTESQRVGMTMKQALARSLERMPVTELQFFATVLLIQQQTGGNMASTLENLSTVLRLRKRLVDKIAAFSSEAKASAMIIGSLPFFVTGILALVNPEYIGLLFTERLGNVLLVGGMTWMAIGILVMHQMINFDQ
jgi:tight adherence protein B